MGCASALPATAAVRVATVAACARAAVLSEVVILVSISPTEVLTEASISPSDRAIVAAARVAWAAWSSAATTSWEFTAMVSDATELLMDEATVFIEVSRVASRSPARRDGTARGRVRYLTLMHGSETDAEIRLALGARQALFTSTPHTNRWRQPAM